MTSLQTVVMGLVIVFLDVPPDGFDWVADPLGWLLIILGLGPLASTLPNHTGLAVTAWVCLAFSVVNWPEGSLASLSPVLGWLFSIPTLAWCFLACDAVADATTGRLRATMLALRTAFLVVVPLPGLVYLAGADWLSLPTEVLILGANLTLLFALWAASSRPGLDEADSARSRAERSAGRRAEREARSRPDENPTPPPAPRPHPARGSASRGARQVTGAEVIEKVRRRRRAREQAEGDGAG